MSEQFKLVFRGEIEDDQHLAVVRKRLGTLLKADDKTLAALFSGQAVVLRKEIDAAGAAKFQAAFKKAGARLRVIPHAAVEEKAATPAAEPTPKSAAATPKKLSLAERLKAAEAAEVTAAPETTTPAVRSQASPSVDQSEAAQPTSGTPATAAEPNATDAAGLRLYPVGADLLEAHEQLPPVLRTVDVSHLTVAEVGERIGPVIEMMADTERFLAAAAAFELAEAGADMAPQQAEAVAPLPAPDLGLAPAGAPLLEGNAVPPPPVVNAPALDLSEPGVRLVEPPPEPQTKAPDTAHLELLTEPDQD